MLVIEKGEIVESGEHTDLLKEKRGIMCDLARSVSESALSSFADSESDVEDVTHSDHGETRLSSVRSSSKAKRSSSMRSSANRSSVSSTEPQKKTTKLMTVEDRATGDVPFSVYKTWFNTGFGACLTSVFLSLYFIIRIFDVVGTFWSSFWSELATADNETSLCLSVYVLLKMLFFACIHVKLAFICLCGLKASLKLFKDVWNEFFML